MGNVDFPMDHTPEEWRAKAAASNKQVADSWERSDTDGFLSQWASGKMAAHYSFMAKVAEKGGKWTFCGVADLDGNLLDAEQRDGQYGYYWLVRRGGEKPDFFTESKARLGATRTANNAKKGYKLVQFEAEVVFVWGEGPGSGLVPKKDAERTVIGDWPEEDY